jgi:hypothetical protein
MLKQGAAIEKNTEVAAAKQKHTYQLRDIERLSRQTGTRIAIIYDVWFVGGVPPEWVRVGTWTIPDNVIDGSPTVSFYAVDPTEDEHLIECLREFCSQLPRDVIQSGPSLAPSNGPAQP